MFRGASCAFSKSIACSIFPTVASLSALGTPPSCFTAQARASFASATCCQVCRTYLTYSSIVTCVVSSTLTLVLASAVCSIERVLARSAHLVGTGSTIYRTDTCTIMEAVSISTTVTRSARSTDTILFRWTACAPSRDIACSI